MSWAEIKKVNSDMSKPLDVLIKELMQRKVQTVTIYLGTRATSLSNAATGELTEIVNPEKTVINIKSQISSENISGAVMSLNYGLKEDGKTIYVYYTPKGNQTLGTGFDIVFEAITQG